MVAATFPKCNDPACDANEPNESSGGGDQGKGCEISEKCVAACAAYGRVCPCFARAAGRAACQALEKLLQDSAVFEPKPDFDKFDCDDLIIKEKLGEGGFSNVNACVLKTGDEAGQELAVKYLKRQVMVEKHNFEHGAADLAIEARFLNALSHEHIIKLHGVTAGSVETNLATGKECGFFIVVDRLYDTLEHRIETWRHETEAMSGGLLSRFSHDLKEKRKRALVDRLKVALDIAETMEYLHSRHIIFRDLKPDNVGFDINGTMKLFDFGLARELKPSEARPDGRYRMTGNTGSRRYMAPEVAKDTPYDQSVDVYSFGILLWEMCTTEKPFYGYSSGKHMTHVVLGGERPKLDASHTAQWPIHLQWLIKRCWSAFPSQRPSFEVVKETLSDMLTNCASTMQSGELKPKPPAGGFAAMSRAQGGRAQTVSHTSSSSMSGSSAAAVAHPVPPPEKGFAALKKPSRTRGYTTNSAMVPKSPEHGANHDPDQKPSSGSSWGSRRTRTSSIDA